MRITSRRPGGRYRDNKHSASALCFAAIAALLLLLPINLQAAERAAVVLQGLDKVTARISKFTAELDTPVVFGTLEITARACHKKTAEEPPESAAFSRNPRETAGRAGGIAVQRLDVRLDPRTIGAAASGL